MNEIARDCLLAAASKSLPGMQHGGRFINGANNDQYTLERAAPLTEAFDDLSIPSMLTS